jgi:hypothetical protein
MSDRYSCRGCDGTNCKATPPCKRSYRVGGRCPAWKTDGSGQCGHAIAPGHKVCRYHGGAAPHVKAAAERRAADEKIRHELDAQRALGVAVDRSVDPHDEFMRLIRESAGVVEFLRSKVQRLQQGWVGRAYIEDLEQAETLEDAKEQAEYSEAGAGLVGPNHLGDGAPNVYLVLYNDERDRLAKYCKMAIDAGIAERQVQIAQDYAQQLANFLRALLAELGVPGTPETFAVVRRHLTVYAGGASVEAA